MTFDQWMTQQIEQWKPVTPESAWEAGWNAALERAAQLIEENPHNGLWKLGVALGLRFLKEAP